jgi:outer membrane lipoprotein-sorting protein
VTDNQQSELLEQYWTALADESATSAPDGLDPELAELSKQLANQLAIPQPDPLFALSLQRKLIAQAQAQHQGVRSALTAVGETLASLFCVRRPVLGGLAALLLLGVLVGLGLWAVNPQPADAQEIVRKAQAAMSQEPTQLDSFVLFQSMVTQYEGTEGSEEIRSESKRWYQSPNYWRSEDTSTVTGPDGKVIPALGFQYITVGDGQDIWDSGPTANEVIVNREPAGMGHIGNAFLFGYSATDLEGFLQPDLTCPDFKPQGTSATPARVAPTPRLLGRETVAGRPTYVIDLGAINCPSVPGLNGRRVIWVDQETFFVLKSELHRLQDDRVIATIETTYVEYNPRLDKALFKFTPPAGARILDLRPKALPTP